MIGLPVSVPEIADPNAPVHVRIEFDVPPLPLGGAVTLIQVIREWDLQGLATLPKRGTAVSVTVTYRGESESWETKES